jgi:hypothetical protein
MSLADLWSARSWLEIAVPLSPDAVLAKVPEALRSGAYTGEVVGSSFWVARRTVGRNGFQPRLEGLVEASPAGTLLRYRLAPHPSAARMLQFWTVLAVPIEMALLGLLILGLLNGAVHTVVLSALAALWVGIPWIRASGEWKSVQDLEVWIKQTLDGAE